MKFVHTVVYEIRGIIAPDNDDLVILNDNGSVWACLTKDPNPHCQDTDQSGAISNMLLRGLVGGGPEGSFRERLDQETALIRAEREKNQAGQTYLVLKREGEITDWETRTEREEGGYVIRLNGSPKKEIREKTRRALSALYLALSFQLENSLLIKVYSDGVIFFRDDGKKVFAKTFTAGVATLTVSSPYPEGINKKVNSTFQTLNRLDNLSRVLKLLTTSVEEVDDRLRAFLSGWAALEIFINKVFKQYEEALFEDLESDELPEAHSQFVKRIREVMKDKYRLTDRFALIASKLAPENADTDVEQFKAAKKIRDDIAHGQDVDDIELPISTVHELLKRYLQHHSENRNR